MVHLKLATWDYDFVSPLATGDVVPEGIDLTLIRRPESLDLVLNDPGVDGGEFSFSQYFHRIARGDTSYVGLPVFLMREFRHRCFVVRRGSDLEDVTQLAGRTVGTDVWAASGNVWTKALIRERGVPIEHIAWVVGPVNSGDAPVPVKGLPEGVRTTPNNRSLAELLLQDEIDAIMCSLPPKEFHATGSRVRRLFRDYRRAEREYYLRTKIFPGIHILVLRRPIVEQHPSVVRSVYLAFKQARERSERNHLMLHESSPWMLTDLEERRALMGEDFQPYGYRENQAMVAAFCEEQLAQKLVGDVVMPDLLFEDFEKLIQVA